MLPSPLHYKGSMLQLGLLFVRLQICTSESNGEKISVTLDSEIYYKENEYAYFLYL